MRKLGLVLLLGGSLFGCSDNDPTPVPPTPPTPNANGVFPSSAFLGRKAHVEISGDNTNWTAATTVSFGASVTVDKVTVASPTDLFADITIAGTATPGMTDVVVTDGASTFTLTQAFQLKAPISIS